jgi:hypothetical protein
MQNATSFAIVSRSGYQERACRLKKSHMISLASMFTVLRWMPGLLTPSETGRSRHRGVTAPAGSDQAGTS